MRNLGPTVTPRPPRLTRSAAAAVLLLALALVLGACAGELATRGEALRLVGTEVPRATLFEQYDAPLNAVGGLRPYTFTIVSGALPPGITLENGVLRGAATETGAYTLSVEVSDANLSRVSQTYTLQVTSPPPPEFLLDVPLTEVRGPVTIRARLKGARAVTGVRSVVTWDPQLFTLAAEGAAASRRDTTLLWQADETSLQVDLAALGTQLTGDVELYRFTLVPVAPPVRVQASFAAEVTTLSPDPARKHEYLTGIVGAAPPAAGNQSVPPADSAPPDAPLEVVPPADPEGSGRK